MVLDFILIIFHIIILAGAEEYHQSDAMYRWTGALQACKIAIPDIHVGENEYFVNITNELTEDVWLGYFKLNILFEYVGCSIIANASLAEVFPKGQNTPGLCYTFCHKEGKHLFGISEGKCFCLNNVPDKGIREVGCNTTCAQEGIACGAGGFLSIYKYYDKGNISKYSDGESCYTFQSNGWSSWEACTKTYKTICIKNGTVHDEMYYSPWNEYTNKCFSRERDLVSLNDIKNVKNASGQSWTNIVSSNAYYTYEDWNESYAIHKPKFGYTKDGKKIKFTKNETTKFVLCQGTATVSQQSTPSTPTSSLSSVTTIDSNQVQTTGRQGTDVGVVVGASVSVVVVVTVVVIVAVCLRRRRKNPDLCNKLANVAAKSYKTETDQVEKIPDKIESTSKEADGFHLKLEENLSENVSDSDHVPNYHVIEPHDRADTGYRKCGDENTTAEQTENVYHEIDGDDNTDYAQVFKDKNDMPNGDDYDTTTSAIKLKTKPEKSQEDYAELGDDTYNHINYLPVNAGSTDNTYNIPNTLNVSQNGERTMGKADPGEKDTYSHINSTAVTNSKTDNVCGTPRD